MSNALYSAKESEINLSELFMTFWKYKFIIIIITLLSFFASVDFVLKTKKIYTAHSAFILESNTTPQGVLSGALEKKLFNFSLPGMSTSPDELLVERLSSREFIIEVAQDLSLHEDKFFNPYDPNQKEPAWKSAINSLIGYKSSPRDPGKIANWNILESFENNVSILQNQAGSIDVNVRHPIPDKAAVIANHIVRKAINMINEENIIDVDSRLSYLSSALAGSVQELENAQKSLKDYGLKNSVQADRAFAAGSILLDDLRLKRDETFQLSQTIIALNALTKGKTPSDDDYLTLRQKFPLIDEQNFRRILGISEVISAWEWPRQETLFKVQESIRDRLRSLDSEIQKLEVDARRYAESSDDLSRVKRRLKVAEATYTVMIEQVKSQSILAGYTPNRSKIIAVADVPITPTEPKPKLIVAAGTGIGLFAGVTIAWFLSLVRGVCFSKTSIFKLLNPKFDHQIGPLRLFRGKNLAEVQLFIQRKPLGWSKQLILESTSVQDRTVLMVLDTAQANNAAPIARIIGCSGSLMDRNFAFISLSANGNDTYNDHADMSDLVIADKVGNCTEYVYQNGEKNIEWLFSKTFEATIEKLLSTHQNLVLSVDVDALDIIQSSPIFSDAALVVYVQTGKTKYKLLESLMRRGNVEVVLHG